MKFKKSSVTRKRTRSVQFLQSKKSLGAVVAISLLLVVSVFAVVGFNSWYSSYSSSMFTDLEIQSDSNENIEIKTIIGNILYLTSGAQDNISINKLEIEGVDCIINENLSKGMNEIDISSCLSNLSVSKPKITIFVGDEILVKSIYLGNIVNTSISSSLGNLLNYLNSFESEVEVWELSSNTNVIQSSNRAKLGTYSRLISSGSLSVTEDLYRNISDENGSIYKIQVWINKDNEPLDDMKYGFLDYNESHYIGINLNRDAAATNPGGVWFEATGSSSYNTGFKMTLDTWYLLSILINGSNSYVKLFDSSMVEVTSQSFDLSGWAGGLFKEKFSFNADGGWNSANSNIYFDNLTIFEFEN